MLDKLIVGLTTSRQAREDARSGLRDMGRGTVWLLKWSGIVFAALIILGVVIVAGLFFQDWAKVHESEWRLALFGGAAGLGLGLLNEIRKLLQRIADRLDVMQDR